MTGTAPDGRAYAAYDPELLTWVHVAEVSSFLKSHLRYRDPDLSTADQNRYYAEVALIAERLGAEGVPRSRAEVETYLERLRPQLQIDARALEILQILRTAPAPSPLLRPFGTLMLHAGIELLPEWASAMFGPPLSDTRRQLIRSGVRRTAPVLRWAVRSASVHRARRRMGLPPR